jgi:hypothetical protein
MTPVNPTAQRCTAYSAASHSHACHEQADHQAITDRMIKIE